MNYRHLLFISLLFISFLSFAQQNDSNIQNYSQKIEGTSLSFTMQAIPGGTFKMGSDKGSPDEAPIHDVKLDPFWMSTFEVTWDIFEMFLYKDYEINQSTGAIPTEVDAVTRPTKPYLDMTFGMGKENHPALAMTQYNAIQFCKWLYVRTGIFYRLPTEAEWEYAARGGEQQSAYFFGDDAIQLNDFAWYKNNSDNKTHEVGKKKPNPWGLYDIYGNVAEWTYDQYVDNYNAFANKVNYNPVVIPERLYPHSIRGGSFQDEAIDLRSAARLASHPSWKQIDPQIPKSNWWMPDAPFIGIRLVRPAILPSKEDIEAYYDKKPIEDY
jgi:sulfatase modifying factor 1